VNVPLLTNPSTNNTGGGTEPSPGNLDTPGLAASKMSADPSTIYVNGSSNGTSKSVVTVEDGIFSPGSEVTISAIVDDADAIDSPPVILGTDKNTTKDGIQLIASSKGGLIFIFHAGSSAGVFKVVASGTPPADAVSAMTMESNTKSASGGYAYFSSVNTVITILE
jgi:hypothetical protein